MKRRPANLADLERTIEIIRELSRGAVVEIEGAPVQIEWTTGVVPVYVAAYGPNALRLAGRTGDGLILQIADPVFIEWALQFVREGAEEAGRDPADIVIQCAVVSAISDDLDDAREQCRWYPAMVGNHIADALRYHSAEQIPAEFRTYLDERSSCDYREHTEPGTEHSQYVPDEIVDRASASSEASKTYGRNWTDSLRSELES